MKPKPFCEFYHFTVPVGMTPLLGASLETRLRDAKSSSDFDFRGEERRPEPIQSLKAKMVQPNIERLI
jgi:hypothetical protein